MLQVLLVFLGGGIGSAIRHGANLAALRLFGSGFPLGTLIINVVGSFVMGLLAAWFAFKAGAVWSQHARLFLTTGILGGFTTFSTFSLDTALLWERDAYLPAVIYVVASVGLGILGLFGGFAIVRSFT
jgi:CrcB protein